jgi:hypothetical protein
MVSHQAAVQGANTAIVSTASPFVDVAAASASTGEVLASGYAGLVDLAMTMALAGRIGAVSPMSLPTPRPTLGGLDGRRGA